MNNYFAHDSNARNDEKLIRLRMKHKAAGYGVYFMILERMRDETNHMCAKDYNIIAFDLREDAGFIKSVVEDFGLFAFTNDGKYFYSESFLQRMQARENVSKVRSEAGKRGAKKKQMLSQDQANAKQMLSQDQANEGVLKEIKEKKENKIKELSDDNSKKTTTKQKTKTCEEKNDGQEQNDEQEDKKNLTPANLAMNCLKCWNQQIKIHQQEYGDFCGLKPATKLTHYRIQAFQTIAKQYSGDDVLRAFCNATENAYCNGRTKDRTRPVQLDWLIDPKHPERFLAIFENTM